MRSPALVNKIIKQFTSLSAMKTTDFNPTLTFFKQQNVSFPVHKFGKILWINSCEVTFLQGEGNYTFIHTMEGKRYLISKSLRIVHQMVNSDFVRIHKSFLVNPIHVSKRSLHAIELADGKIIPIARRRAKDVHSSLLGVMQ